MRHRWLSAFALTGVVILGAGGAVQASDGQGPGPAGAVEAIAGYTGFIDEEMVNHAVAGAAGRFYLTTRVAVGGEVIRMWGPGEDRDWLLLPFVSVDLGSGRVVPYLVGGAGLLSSTTSVGTGSYTSNSWSLGGGGGVRVAMGRTAYLAFEGRLGTEPLTRATVAIGWRLR